MIGNIHKHILNFLHIIENKYDRDADIIWTSNGNADDNNNPKLNVATSAGRQLFEETGFVNVDTKTNYKSSVRLFTSFGLISSYAIGHCANLATIFQAAFVFGEFSGAIPYPCANEGIDLPP